MRRSADRHSDRYPARNSFVTANMRPRAPRFFGGFDFAKSSSLLSGALEAASWVLFGARLKIPDPNPSAKDYPRDITVIIDFFSFTSFHTTLPANGKRVLHSPHVRFVFSIFLVRSLSHIIRRLSHTMRHHICNHWPAALWKIGEFSVKIVYNSSEIFSRMTERERASGRERERVKCKNILWYMHAPVICSPWRCAFTGKFSICIIFVFISSVYVFLFSLLFSIFI